jgi:hypothetical protein
VAVAGPSLHCGCGQSLTALWLWPVPHCTVAVASPSLHRGCGQSLPAPWLWPVPHCTVAVASPSLHCGCDQSLTALWLCPVDRSVVSKWFLRRKWKLRAGPSRYSLPRNTFTYFLVCSARLVSYSLMSRAVKQWRLRERPLI